MNDGVKIKIEDLGYNTFFESNRKKLELDSFSIARVISEFKGGYKVINTIGEYLAKITGKQMFKAVSREDYPAVGDWVAITELDNERAVIHKVLPRLSVIKRRYGDKNQSGQKDKTQLIATNIDVAFAVESVNRDYNLNRFERYLGIAKDGGVKPAIILNKIDLISRQDLDAKLCQLKSRLAGIDMIPTSTVSGEGMDELTKYIIKGITCCFLGSSGVGKSSLINKLLGENLIKTADISSSSGRGMHTTAGRQMYFLKNGGIVIDNPGTREIGMTDAVQGIDGIFDDITVLALKCRYTDCTHVHEPGCVVLAAVKSGELDAGKYSNYINLKKEARYFGMNDAEKRDKDRQFGKFVKKAKDDLKNHRHKDY
jgi:ribosome biogenesis GTPase / thiamine phosphate phosphatase